MLFLYLQTPLLVQVALLDFVTHQSSRTPYFTHTIFFAFFALKVLVTPVSLFHAQGHAAFFFANFPTKCSCKIAPEIKSEVKIEKGNQDSAARSSVSSFSFVIVIIQTKIKRKHGNIWLCSAHGCRANEYYSL